MAAAHYTPKDIQRFWKKVAITSNIDQCWNWIAYRDKRGYGCFGHNNKVKLAHRISWELAYGEIPCDLDVLHRCDNPSCVNPNHLSVGTHLMNMQDRNAKGRQAKGEQVGSHKLTSAQVVEIRSRYAAGGVSMRKLGREMGVAHVQIIKIIRRETWRDAEVTSCSDRVGS